MAVSAEFLLPDLTATETLAQGLAVLLQAGDVVLLEGDLGAGKTAFARALIQALGATSEIPSPTFTLVQHYDLSAFPVAHFDLYRLKQPEEIEELGFDDALADGVTLVEWPEKALAYMPQGALRLLFEVVPGGQRKVRILGPDIWIKRLG